MSTSFFIRTTKTRGMTKLFVRFQSVKQKINHKISTPLLVDIQVWNNSRNGTVQMMRFRDAHPELAQKMDEIKTMLDATLSGEVGITQKEFADIVDDVVYREVRHARKTKEEEAKLPSLNEYVAQFLDQIASGARQTDRGRNYAGSTVRSIRHALHQFTLFEQTVKREYDFQDIDMAFYYDFTAYLKRKGYSINSVGKCVRQIKALLHAAELDGLAVNPAWKRKQFKGTRIEVDSIYLTLEDIHKMMAADLSDLSPEYEQARDVFMVGVWTAQRISDYNHIRKEDFEPLTINGKEITSLNIRQRKTGVKVSIPCNAPLKAILEKYDYHLPRLRDQVINRDIKEVARRAGLTNLVEIETTKGGVSKKERFEKWQLVYSHTARRTGATLMYLAGIDIYDIMRITGHSTPAMVKKYIKADSLAVAEKLAGKYIYFK